MDSIWPNVKFMLEHRLWGWPNINRAPGQCIVFTQTMISTYSVVIVSQYISNTPNTSQQTRDVEPLLI